MSSDDAPLPDEKAVEFDPSPLNGQMHKELERLADALRNAEALNAELLEENARVRIDRDRFEAASKECLRKYDQKVTEFLKVSDEKNHAYWERNQLVVALSKLFPASLERHSGTGWDDDWRWLVMIILPTGQASWHIHDSELDFFDHLPRQKMIAWDGHTTAEKYLRLQMLSAPKAPILIPVAQWTGDLRCTYEARHAGIAYPRTCSLCGLGPCKLGHKA